MNGMNGTRMNTRTAVRSVALFEALKGLIAFLVATGALTLLHKDVYELAVRLVEHAHLDPAARYPGILLEAAARVHDPQVLLLAAGAVAYSVLRWIEAYGLYRARRWAELLAAASGAIYVPFELVELARRPSWLGLAFLLANLVVVAIMVRALGRRGART